MSASSIGDKIAAIIGEHTKDIIYDGDCEREQQLRFDKRGDTGCQPDLGLHNGARERMNEEAVSFIAYKLCWPINRENCNIVMCCESVGESHSTISLTHLASTVLKTGV